MINLGIFKANALIPLDFLSVPNHKQIQALCFAHLRFAERPGPRFISLSFLSPPNLVARGGISIATLHNRISMAALETIIETDAPVASLAWGKPVSCLWYFVLLSPYTFGVHTDNSTDCIFCCPTSLPVWLCTAQFKLHSQQSSVLVILDKPHGRDASSHDWTRIDDGSASITGLMAGLSDRPLATSLENRRSQSQMMGQLTSSGLWSGCTVWMDPRDHEDDRFRTIRCPKIRN